MNINKIQKADALQAVNAIYQTIQENLKITVNASEVIAHGIAVTAIPFCEYLLTITLDPILKSLSLDQLFVIFLTRILFYGTLFNVISTYFEKRSSIEQSNNLLKKLTETNTFFPIIPIATAIALVMTNNQNLIAPMICIILGSQLLQFSNFTSPVLRTTAWTQILIGISSIFMTQYAISNLWAYTIMLYGSTLILAGIWLLKKHAEK